MKQFTLLILAVYTLSAAARTGAQTLELRGTLNLAGRTCAEAVGNYAYTAGSNHFAVVDVSQPSSPVLRGQLAPGAATINAISVWGDYAYCAGSATGLVVIRISTPTTPVWTSSISTGAPALGVAARDTLVAVAGSNGISLFGVRSPASPHFLTRHSSAATWVEFDPSGTLLHVGSNQGARLLQIEVSVSGGDTTLVLQQTDEYGTEHMTPLDVAGSYLDAVNLATLVALDLNDYSLAGSYTAPAAIRAIAGTNHAGFLGLANGSVYCINQQTDTPQFAAGVTVPGAPTGVAMASSDGQSLVVVSHSVGVSVLAYTPLAAPETNQHELPDDITLTAYPNPFNAVVTLQIAVPRDGFVSIEITDQLGRVVSNQELTLHSTVEQRFDFSGRSAGIYFARISGTFGNKTTKLLFLP